MLKTVLLTGASGYIAKHIALELLQVGYHVRGRSDGRGAPIGDQGGLSRQENPNPCLA